MEMVTITQAHYWLIVSNIVLVNRGKSTDEAMCSVIYSKNNKAFKLRQIVIFIMFFVYSFVNLTRRINYFEVLEDLFVFEFINYWYLSIISTLIVSFLILTFTLFSKFQ